MAAFPKTAIVTGASGAIGEAISRQLACQGSYRVLMLARSKQKLKAAAERVSSSSDVSSVEWHCVDLSRQCEVQRFASACSEPIDVLVNNAASAPRSRQETPEEIEQQFATNVLGYYWMIQSFRERLAHSVDARVVNVASYWASGLELSDLQFEKRAYDNDSAYRQSKQADRMLTAGFAHELQSAGITVNACHPGDVRSKLSSDLGFGGHQTPDQGAETPVWLASSADVFGQSGKYFEHLQESVCSFGQDTPAVERLMEICASF